MTLTLRKFEREDDYWRVRAFLREVYLFNGRRDFSWQAYRLDYWRFFGNPCLNKTPLEDVVYYWETPGGQIAAVTNIESPGEAFFHIHPERRAPGLEAGGLEAHMLNTAEACLSKTTADGKKELTVWCLAADEARQVLLESRGYANQGGGECARYRSLETPIDDASPAPGYTIRSLGGEDELPARSWASWRAFHPNAPDEAYEGYDWYAQYIQSCPMYRRDLDIVAVSPEGEIVGFATIWFDDVTRSGGFEPVGLMPEHQRKGLGKALMAEGMRRVKRLGAVHATVGSYSAGAHALYAAAGFTDYDLSQPWKKVW